MAKNFYKFSKGINLAPQSSTPTSPGNGDFYYDTTLAKFRRYENGAWRDFTAAAGSKNYISAYTASTSSGVQNPGNGDLELGATTGFSLGTATLTNNFPSGAPTFGSGASGNLSLSAISSSQLAGAYSLGYTSSAATTAGNFVATDAFFIDEADKAKILQFKLAYNAFANGSNGNFSGTSSNSFGVAIYDVTNSAWIQPSGSFGMTQNSGTGFVTGTFQTTSNSTQYRIVIYNANATSGAITMYFDDFSVGPQILLTGAVITDPISSTATTTGFGTITANSLQQYRVGAFLHIFGTFRAGTPAASACSIDLPSGLTIDTAYYTGLGAADLGYWETVGSTASSATFSLDGSTAAIQGHLFYDGSDNNSVFFATSATAVGFNKRTGTQITDATASITVTIKVKIAGWSSNVQTSNDTDTRIVAARYKVPTGTISASYGNVIYGTKDYDTHNAYNSSTGVFTAPMSGQYRVSFAFSGVATRTSSTSLYAQIKKNGTGTSLFISPSTGSGTIQCIISGSDTVYLNAGDTLAVTANDSGTSPSYNDTSLAFISVERLSGPSVIAASESVSCKYQNTAGTSITSSIATVPFATKIYDTHGSFNGSVFTAPIAGEYEVCANFWMDVNSTSIDMAILVTSTPEGLSGAVQYVTSSSGISGSVSHTMFASRKYKLNAGNTIAIQLASGTTGNLNTSAGRNVITVTKVGN